MQKNGGYLVLDREKVKKLYLQGYKNEEIAKMLSSKTDTIKKCIQRNFNDLKLEHKIAVVQRKETLRALRHESNRYMGERSFILKNRTIYKTLPNGDIVVNRKVSGTITSDTPTRLVNENKCLTNEITK